MFHTDSVNSCRSWTQTDISVGTLPKNFSKILILNTNSSFALGKEPTLKLSRTGAKGNGTTSQRAQSQGDIVGRSLRAKMKTQRYWEADESAYIVLLALCWPTYLLYFLVRRNQINREYAKLSVVPLRKQNIIKNKWLNALLLTSGRCFIRKT